MQDRLTPKSIVWAVHLVFWLLAVMGIFIVYYRLVENAGMALVAASLNLVGLVLLVYGHLYFLVPRFFKRQRYLGYAVSVLLLLLVSSVLRFYLGKWVVSLFGWPLADWFSPSFFGNMVFGGTFFLLLSIPLQLINNWYKNQELEQALKTHQLAAELRFLKAQVNPHFLFNALNNIYSLSFTESKQAPGMILKLSDMMSYMLYDCKSELVPLQAEVNYLRNYIDLQQLKKEGEMQIEFSHEDINGAQQITPMLFIPFFENAFKHGNLEDTQQGWLRARMHEADGQLQFEISNSYLEVPKVKTQKGGVGLENVRQRLALLYPDNHQLDISTANGEYRVQLTLNLRP
ncbi:MAG: histidine kinase [Bacteroidota bacterium]